jgi:hypothetical protein
MKTKVLIAAMLGCVMACPQVRAQSAQGFGSPGYSLASGATGLTPVAYNAPQGAETPPTAQGQPVPALPAPSAPLAPSAPPATSTLPAATEIAPAASNGGPCKGSGSSCGGCCSCDDPCDVPCWRFFGEYLYLRPRNAAVGYGVAFNGPVVQPGTATPVQIARPGIVDIDYQSGYRLGFATALDSRTEIAVSYTRFDGDTAGAISADAPFLVRSMVQHPSTWQVTSDGLDAAAAYSMKFDLVDLDYRWTFLCGHQYSLTGLAGIRYAHLEQDFASQYAVNGAETVMSEIQFEGGGLRVGLEGERRSCRTGLLVYGHGIASFVAGTSRAAFAQGQAFDASVVDTGWKDGRIVSMLDLELGIGWTGCNEHLRLTAGYLISGWYNVVKTDRFIDAVQRNNFIGMGDTLTFDGVVARAELRF